MPLFTCPLNHCQLTLRFGAPAVCPARGHPLVPHEGVGLVTRWDTGCIAAMKAEQAFDFASFKMSSFMPATQRGLFDLAMHGNGRQVYITVKLFPRFTMPDLKRDWGMLKDAYSKVTPWTESEKMYWMAEQQMALDDIWNKSTFKLRLDVPSWQGQRDFKPEFRIVFVSSKSEAHIVADIEKAPPTDTRFFNCGGSRLNLAQIITGNPKAVSTAAMNSESGRPVKMNSTMLGHQVQDVVVMYNIMAHEYGHMIGLPDEYNIGGEIKGKDIKADAYNIHCDATNKLCIRAGTAWQWNTRDSSLMSTGNEMRLRHLITVWEAMTVATEEHTKPAHWSIV